MYRKPDPRLPEIGTRLALTRWALDLTRFQMARLLGTDTSSWGTYEAGLQRIPADQALKLSPYGIPLDWIYDGKVANLHPRQGGCPSRPPRRDPDRPATEGSWRHAR